MPFSLLTRESLLFTIIVSLHCSCPAVAYVMDNPLQRSFSQEDSTSQITQQLDQQLVDWMLSSLPFKKPEVHGVGPHDVIGLGQREMDQKAETTARSLRSMSKYQSLHGVAGPNWYPMLSYEQLPVVSTRDVGLSFGSRLEPVDNKHGQGSQAPGMKAMRYG
jgi:hypothetical protein